MIQVVKPIAAALGRDIDEKEREKQRQRSFERSWIRMAEEIFGLYFFGQEIVSAWEATFSPFKRADVLRSPVGEVLADVALGIGEAARTVSAPRMGGSQTSATTRSHGEP